MKEDENVMSEVIRYLDTLNTTINPELNALVPNWHLVFRTNRIESNRVKFVIRFDRIESLKFNSWFGRIKSNQFEIRFDSTESRIDSIRFVKSRDFMSIISFFGLCVTQISNKKSKKIYFFVGRLSPKKEMICLISRDRIVESNRIESSQIRIRFDDSTESDAEHYFE
jgi:hypothetical protein